MDVSQPLESAAAVVRPAGRWLAWLARWGFVANAVVYLVVGTLMVRWAIGEGGRITDPEGALRAIRGAGGTALLLVLIPGFFSYALWRVLAAIFDGDGDGAGAAGIASRSFAVIKAGAYAGLGLTALRIALGTPQGNRGFIDGFVTNPVVLFAVGAGVLTFACYEVSRSLRAKLSEKLRLGEVPREARRWVVGISRFGIGARALVLGSFGVLALGAVLTGHPSRPAATASIHTAANGHPAFYLLIGAGFIAYGVYLVVLAKYRTVRTA